MMSTGLKKGLDKSILDLPAHAESGACPDSARTNPAIACAIRAPAIHGRRKLQFVQRFLKRAPIATALPLVLAAVAAVWCLYVVLRHPVLHWYADAWRVYPQLMELTWWQAALAIDNGHRPVVSQVLRWLDLHVYAGDHRLLHAVAVVWISACMLAIAAAAWRAAGAVASTRAQAVLVAVLSIAWLGHVRMLSHPYEAVHIHLVLLLVAIAAAIVAARGDGALSLRQRVALLLVGAGAALVFGPGVALLPAVLVILLLTRAPLREIIAVGVATGLMLALYIAMPGADGVVNSLAWEPRAQADAGLRWLATPLLFLLLPVLDPDAAAAVPIAAVRASLIALAQAWQQHVGDVWTTAVPARLVGLALMLAYAWLIAGALRVRPQPLAVLGLTLATFALGVGALIALTRVDYFALHPREIHAARYLPWSSLAWAGVSLAALARPLAPSLVRWRSAAVVAVAIACLASNVGGHRWAIRVAALAAEQSAAAREGRDPVVWGETQPGDFQRALGPARARNVGPWAAP